MQNPLFNILNEKAGQMTPQIPISPLQRINYVIQAMQNPPAFVKQNFPDIPDSILNDPNQVLSYLQRTRGITNEQIQMAAQQASGFMRR